MTGRRAVAHARIGQVWWLVAFGFPRSTRRAFTDEWELGWRVALALGDA